jgi:hypothetical protein
MKQAIMTKPSLRVFLHPLIVQGMSSRVSLFGRVFGDRKRPVLQDVLATT